MLSRSLPARMLWLETHAEGRSVKLSESVPSRMLEACPIRLLKAELACCSCSMLHTVSVLTESTMQLRQAQCDASQQCTSFCLWHLLLSCQQFMLHIMGMQQTSCGENALVQIAASRNQSGSATGHCTWRSSVHVCCDALKPHQ